MVSKSLSDDETSDEGGSAPLTYAEIFYKHFPYYLSIGMSETQYWDSDCLLAKYYREADQLKQERINQNAWLQGMYIYDAVSRLSPILHAFAKKGTKAKPYPSEPYPINERTKKEADNHKEKAKLDKGLLYMQQFKAKSEIYFKEREGK